MIVKKIVVDSSIIVEHLVTTKKESILRKLSAKYFCYTTVFCAIELFAAAQSLKEKEAVQKALNALKVLGINPKSAKNIALSISSTIKDFAALTAGICIESKLPIITLNPKRYSGVKGLTVLSAVDLLK